MSRRILIVDDEKHMRSLLLKAIDNEDTTIATAEDGDAAYNYMQQHETDLVISDISMPKMQGTDLFFKLKKMNPFIQIIMITAYPSLKTITDMLEGGASDFIIKPFDIEQIQNIVDETFARIERWKSLRKEWLRYKKSVWLFSINE